MSTTVTTSNEWMQFYEQSIDELSTSSLGFSDATIVATSMCSPSESHHHSPGSTSGLHSSASDQQLTPRGSSSKPIRRRSRASKKTPTTLLNATASNFRALVQQFTGCPSNTHLGNRRGPINLNFAQSGTSATPVMPASGNDYFHQQSHQENASRQQHQPLYQQEQQYAVPYDNVHDDALFSSSSRRANADHILDDDFNLDNISLEELNRGLPYSNENDGNYFL
ncbi:hypothetical protein PTKIN_Ptkin02bG0257200 [Pterospermum kingtungense]